MDYVCYYKGETLDVAASTVDGARTKAARTWNVPERLKLGITVKAQLPGERRQVRTSEGFTAAVGPFAVAWSSETPDVLRVTREGSEKVININWEDFK